MRSPGQRRGRRSRGLRPLGFVVAALLGALLALGPVASLAQVGEPGGGTSTGGGDTTLPPETTTVGSTATTTTPTVTTTVPRPRPLPRPTTTTPRPRPRTTTTAPTSSPTAVAPVPTAAGGDGGFQSTGSASVGGSAALISPFPVVRIAGTLTRRGARIRLLSVRAPAGTAIAARCRGGACPRALARKAVSLRVRRSGGAVRLRALQRSYRAGTQLRILVTRPGLYGKYTRFRIRRGKAPARTDMCLAPVASARPSRCPR